MQQIGSGLLNDATANLTQVVIQNDQSAGDSNDHGTLMQTASQVQHQQCESRQHGGWLLHLRQHAQFHRCERPHQHPSAVRPAVDGGDNATCSSLDQRGIHALQAISCDIGANVASCVRLVYNSSYHFDVAIRSRICLNRLKPVSDRININHPDDILMESSAA